MPEKNQIYKYNKCDNVVKVVQGGQGELVCCNEPMQLLSKEEASPFLTPPSMKPGAP
ncbi:MAG: desulfoferrodoxin FeS4 iron-binding domain-containing protein [Desulfohalobiaceae bacterium]|nr:desulfoferrodoxin FeS4 iron-binding domain-containing protein [Desulfohalobiaceae bacterium]